MCGPEFGEPMKKILAYGFCLVLLVQGGAPAAEFRFSPRPNRARLISWHEWSPEMLAEARKTDRLIVLSLSAVWCHWCHVMDETTWSDDRVIALLNRRFIPVRVDADLRPDIDALYNQGGWPSTVILTPDGEVVDGGNYIPAGEMAGRLERAEALYRNNRKTIEARAEVLRHKRQAARESRAAAAGRLSLDDITAVLQEAFDEKYGGFGSGQKFPSPDALEFLLSRSAATGDPSLRRIVTLTLDRMAGGGIRDRAGGGFFRYATRPDWSAPHYEKMLEVNAGMVLNYAHAFQAFGAKRYRRVVRETVRYVERNLFDGASGALYNSQDADEEYYAAGKRAKRPPPGIDHTVAADSSSLMISALLAAGDATGDGQYRRLAVRAADFVIANMTRPEEGVFHSYRNGAAGLPGQLNDNALFGLALLDLSNSTGEARYLEGAGRIARLMTSRFFLRADGRFRTSLSPAGVAPAAEGRLTAINADLANFRAVRFLARFAQMAPERKRKEIEEIVDAALAALSGPARDFAPGAPTYGLALLWGATEPLEARIVAERGRARDYLAALGRVFAPVKVVRVLSLTGDREEIRSYGYPFREAVYLCAGSRCSLPVQDPAKLAGALRRFLRTAAH